MDKCQVCLKAKRLIELESFEFINKKSMLPNKTLLETTIKDKEVFVCMIIFNNRKEIIETHLNNEFKNVKMRLNEALNFIVKSHSMLLYELKYDYCMYHENKEVLKACIEQLHTINTYNDFKIKTIIAKKNEKDCLQHLFLNMDRVNTINPLLKISLTEYNKTLNEIKKEKKVYQDIMWSLENDKVFIYKQLIKGDINKYECLLRLEDKNGEIHAPFSNQYKPHDILSIAKKYNIYHLITKKVIEQSFSFFEETPFSINLEIEDLENLSVMKTLIKHIKHYPKANLIIEITETHCLLMKHFLFLNKLRKKYNIKLSLDDFGSGYSNFINLTLLDTDFVKIDGSLIRDIHLSKEKQIILKHIINLSKDLKKKTVAEFVSNEVVYEYLINNYSIDYYQGYFFGIPTPLKDN